MFEKRVHNTDHAGNLTDFHVKIDYEKIELVPHPRPPLIEKMEEECPTAEKVQFLERMKSRLGDSANDFEFGSDEDEEQVEEGDLGSALMNSFDHLPDNILSDESVARRPHIVLKEASLRQHEDVAHEWLCDGRLLLLLDPKDVARSKPIFQDQWLRGQPIMIAHSSHHLNQKLWTPESFQKDFGHLKHTLINCLTGNTVPNAELKKFWVGFERVTKRLRDQKGTPMLLKLKDWPPKEDLAVYMPERFEDLINSFPMPEYTLR